MHPIPLDKVHCIPAFFSYGQRYPMPYMVLDVLHEVPVQMDMGTQPMHNTLVLNNHLLQQKPSHHPRLSATFFPRLCGCTLLTYVPPLKSKNLRLYNLRDEDYTPWYHSVSCLFINKHALIIFYRRLTVQT